MFVNIYKYIYNGTSMYAQKKEYIYLVDEDRGDEGWCWMWVGWLWWDARRTYSTVRLIS